MWNWNIGKTLLFGLASVLVLLLAGISIRGTLIIAISFTSFVNWLIQEINFIRNTHGSNLEEIETEIEEMKKKKEKK